ncbi:hypothetical protein VQL36_14500 [Chengkuizengella sp. SCS-71B]|uniref:hypothetical protein n=1 Tax=Chengkuizengella sp. SCS-71B TaxID=3115290 RepID=UPI0032C2431D
MKKHVVIRGFIDKITKKQYKMGDLYEANKERAVELTNGGFIAVEVNDDPDHILDHNVSEVLDSITEELTKAELRELFDNESSGKNRTTVLKHIESLLGESLL